MSTASASDDLPDDYLQLDQDDDAQIREMVAERVRELLEPTRHDVEDVDVDGLVDALMPHVEGKATEMVEDPEYAGPEHFKQAVQHITPLDLIILLESDRKI